MLNKNVKMRRQVFPAGAAFVYVLFEFYRCSVSHYLG